MGTVSDLSKKTHPLCKVFFSFLGIGSLAWFLVRVIPRPSRAAYPCMRVAAPIASTFVLWLLGIGTSFLFLKRAREYVRRSRYILALAALAAGGIAGGTFISTPHSRACAAVTPNAPVGTAKGAKPGRVVWVYDSAASNWLGIGNGHWWLHTNQRVVDTMLSHTLCQLSGKTNDSAAWDTLFRYFNVQHGRGSKGYTKGEKIAIKVNMTMGSHNPGWCNVDTATYSLSKELDFVETSPQVVHALLQELVNVVGANQADISIGDPSAYYPNEFYDSCHAAFPNVKYVDYGGKFGRTRVTFSDTPFYWSCRPTGVAQDFVPAHYVQATYVINLGPMKSHLGAGITICAKNNYGSLIRLPTDSGYYSLHQTLAYIDSQMGQYRAVVDLMGERHLGGKTLLYLVDGIYEQNHNNDTAPHKWAAPPFNGGWTCSLFASQDPVAIECVLFDLLQLDSDPYNYPAIPGAPDYLNEAAQANNPPSGTFYDPNHATATSRLANLGVCEHWDNGTDRKYSRNLSTSGTGIELIYLHELTAVRSGSLTDAAHQGFSLQAVPGTSTLQFLIPSKGQVSLDLLDMNGRVAEKLVDAEMTAGMHRVSLAVAGSKQRTPAPGAYIAALYSKDGGSLKLVSTCPVSLVRK